MKKIVVFFLFFTKIFCLNLEDFGVRARLGSSYSLLPKRGKTLLLFSDGSVRTLGRIPQAEKLFKLPIYFSGELNYYFSPRVMFFGEFACRYAHGKELTDFFSEESGAINLTTKLGDLITLAGYFGNRFYFYESKKLQLYFGQKLGLLHSSVIKADIFIEDTSFTSGKLFFAGQSISAGLQIGFDTDLYGCLNFTGQAELIASSGPENNRNLKVDESRLGIASISVGSIGTTLTFPLTFGFAYIF